MSEVVSFLLLAETAALVIISLLLAYPVVAYAQNVAYTWGLVLLSAAFFAVTASYVTTFFFGLQVVSSALDLTGATLAALGTWRFARPFIRVEDDMDVTTPRQSTATDGTTGGFEGARDD